MKTTHGTNFIKVKHVELINEILIVVTSSSVGFLTFDSWQVSVIMTLVLGILVEDVVVEANVFL